jgi:hypothetical protein
MGRSWKQIVPAAAAGLCVGALVTAMAVGQPGGDATRVRNQGEPVAQHGELVKLAGEYTTASKLFIADGEDAIESEGTAKVTAIMDGRFIAIDETGETLGSAFRSQKIWGFNGAAGKYESVWLYTGSTAMTRLSGKAAEGGKTVKLEGSFEDGDGETRYAVEFSWAEGKGFKVVQTALNADGTSGVRVETVYTRR